MRNNAREAALNVIFAQQFNSDCMDALKKKRPVLFSEMETEDGIGAEEMFEEEQKS